MNKEMNKPREEKIEIEKIIYDNIDGPFIDSERIVKTIKGLLATQRTELIERVKILKADLCVYDPESSQYYYASEKNNLLDEVIKQIS